MIRINLTKEDFITLIMNRAKKAKPYLREELLKLLRGKTKSELKVILGNIRVSRDGYDIRID